MMHSISADYVKPLRIAQVLTRMGGDDLGRLSLEFSGAKPRFAGNRLGRPSRRAHDKHDPLHEPAYDTF